MHRPDSETLKVVLQEGIDDAINRQVLDDADRVFAGRMATKLNWALHRIQELEVRAAEDSWQLNPDRMGGQFTDQEIADARRERW